MTLSIKEKRNFYQDSKSILHNDHYENFVRSINKEQDTSTFINNNIFYFQSADKFLNNTHCKYSHSALENNSISLLGLHKSKQDYQEIHLIRDKESCLIVIGDYLLAMINEKDIEKRISNSFAGQCANLIDSDLYICTIDQLDNTSAVFKLKKILQYLTEYNYKKVKIIFQMQDPVRCFSARWWNFQNSNTHDVILKKHPSYHFITDESILDFVTETPKDNINFIFDSYYFSLTKSQLILSPHEFYQMYEWSIMDLIEKIVNDKQRFFDIDYRLYKDFFQVCNNDLPKLFKNFTFIEFLTNTKLLLPYDSQEGKFARDRAKIVPETDIEDINYFITTFFPKNVRVIYNTIVEPTSLTKNFFINPTPTQYNSYDSNWKNISVDSLVHKNFANHLLQNAGWHKQ